MKKILMAFSGVGLLLFVFGFIMGFGANDNWQAGLKLGGMLAICWFFLLGSLWGFVKIIDRK